MFWKHPQNTRMYLWWSLGTLYLLACQVSYHRSLLLRLCDVFQALINSLVCWFGRKLCGPHSVLSWNTDLQPINKTQHFTSHISHGLLRVWRFCSHYLSPTQWLAVCCCWRQLLSCSATNTHSDYNKSHTGKNRNTVNGQMCISWHCKCVFLDIKTFADFFSS